jgi:hypothetical protein
VILVRKLRSYGRLSRAERRLAMKSIALVACVRLALWVLPFLKLQAICERFRGVGRPSEHPADAQQIARAVRLAGRYVPRATCLTQALAAQILLGWNGHEGQVHIGVARDAKNGFRAHAWVESEGKILVGGSEEIDDYSRMLVLDGSARR